MAPLTRLMRKPHIQKALHFLDNGKAYTREDIMQSINRKENVYKIFPKSITGIHLTLHAYRRWNERVGPFMRWDDLQTLLNKLFFIPARIKMVSEKRGAIDGDILFVYELKKNIVHIKTFYGRISLQPALQNLRELRTLRFKQKEKINLSESQNTLEMQRRPVVPDEYVEFSGRTTRYLLEKYSVLSNEGIKIFYYVKTMQNDKVKKVIEIDPLNPHGTMLTSSVLYVLNTLGCKEFAQKHLEFHKPEQVKKAVEKYQEYQKKKQSLH